MQPWKISVGFTVIIIAVAGMVAGERFAYIEPHLGHFSRATGRA